MLIFNIEQNNATYFADFAVFGAGTAALLIFLATSAPRSLHWALVLCGLGGLALWTLIEYGVHRFVLHRIPPFRDMHEMHHRNPRQLIGTPTVVTATIFVVIVFLSALWFAGIWLASALTLGVLVGYIVYSVVHHATHHWWSSSEWFKRRKQIHGRHHRFGAEGNYGVTTSLWDHVFGSRRTF
jgi:cyclopropane-fatty-acyl-phospholipid synthase